MLDVPYLPLYDKVTPMLIVFDSNMKFTVEDKDAESSIPQACSHVVVSIVASSNLKKGGKLILAFNPKRHWGPQWGDGFNQLVRRLFASFEWDKF